MSPTDRDLSGGLSAEREDVRHAEPDVAFWSENLLFALYDPKCDVGLWLHLGTVPNDWTLWHEMNYAMLPGDQGVLSMWSYHRTAPERRPGGAGLEFRCVEPFTRWHLSFDGYGMHTTNEAMQEGLARVAPNRRFEVELDVDCVTPVWDAHAGAVAETGRGSMHDQGWAREHYEQLYRARGTVRFGADEPISFDGYGWRDHSQGPRGGTGGAPWGGHVITGTLYDSGRGWGASRYWTPDGTISLEGGWVCGEDGMLHHAEVLEAPRLRHLAMSGEQLPFTLRWPGGVLETAITTTRSLWLSMMKGLAVGKDLDGPGLMYALNHGTSVWDGESGVSYVERSDMLNNFPETLRRG